MQVKLPKCSGKFIWTVHVFWRSCTLPARYLHAPAISDNFTWNLHVFFRHNLPESLPTQFKVKKILRNATFTEQFGISKCYARYWIILNLKTKFDHFFPAWKKSHSGLMKMFFLSERLLTNYFFKVQFFWKLLL